MTMRFNSYKWVKGGIIDYSVSGNVTGEIEFAHLGKVVFDLCAEMKNDLEGAIVEFENKNYDPNSQRPTTADKRFSSKETAEESLKDFSNPQRGELTDLIADESQIYFKWDSTDNGLCAIELIDTDSKIVIKHPTEQLRWQRSVGARLARIVQQGYSVEWDPEDKDPEENRIVEIYLKSRWQRISEVPDRSIICRPEIGSTLVFNLRGGNVRLNELELYTEGVVGTEFMAEKSILYIPEVSNIGQSTVAVLDQHPEARKLYELIMREFGQ